MKLNLTREQIEKLEVLYSQLEPDTYPHNALQDWLAMYDVLEEILECSVISYDDARVPMNCTMRPEPIERIRKLLGGE